MEKVKVGIIGCGGMGNLHAKMIQKIEGAEVFAASDTSEERLKMFKDNFNPAHSFTDYKELIELNELNAVLICLPTYLHKEPVVLAAKNKKAVFCEKPISLTLEDADTMINECEKNGVLFTIGFVRRFSNQWLKVKEIINEGRIGRPVIYRDIRAQSAPRSPWYMDANKGAGPFMDGCIHNYDFVRYMFGDIQRVVGIPATLNKNVSALDTGTFVLEFKSGDQHLLNWSWGLPAKCRAAVGINDILGPKGVLSFQSDIDKELLPKDFDELKEGAFLLNFGEEKEIVRYELNELFKDQMVHFINCIKGKEKPKVTGLDGYEALKIAVDILNQV